MITKNLTHYFIFRKLRHFIFTTTCGRSPRRARKTIVLPPSDLPGDEQPQCVSFARLNFRGLNRFHTNSPAVAPTIPNAAISCQFTDPTYSLSPLTQPFISLRAATTYVCADT